METKEVWLQVIGDLVEDGQREKENQTRKMLRQASVKKMGLASNDDMLRPSLSVSLGSRVGGDQQASNVDKASQLFDRAWPPPAVAVASPRVLAAISLCTQHREHTQELDMVVKDLIHPLEDVLRGAQVHADKNDTRMQATASSLSVNIYNFTSTFKKNNQKVLEKNPDVSVFFKTTSDLNRLNLEFLNGLDKRLEAVLIIII